MSAVLWAVVGGGSSGGVLVREGEDTSSPATSERLSTGALVKQLKFVSETSRLQFRRLTGTGPETGWVSIKFKGNDLLVTGNFWTVVGGGSSGGLLVREGHDTASPQAAERLSTGALVKELQFVSDASRLHYEKLTGSGPARGWVSVKLKNNVLLERAPANVTASKSAEPQPAAPPPKADRKPRILALHGAPGNSNIMKFQVTSFKKALGKDFEWVFWEGPCKWEPVPGATALNLSERTPVEKMLAKDLPFVQWYSHPEPDEGGPKEMSFEGVVYLNVERGFEYLDEKLQKEGPFDAVVAFSQSGTMVAMYMDYLRRLGREVPWKLSVFFCGAMIDDVKYVLKEKLSQPAIYVQGGDADPWGAHGKKQLPLMYEEVKMFEHQDGHTFPQTNAGEIYEEIAREMRDRCGLAGADTKMGA
mmetsp:Transcript_132966/g.231102  ORF Transcript_132966/g.231102 Transcript_132966/m.231102 type:complete len:418 (-) Transcript_132966:67-1320(-)